MVAAPDSGAQQEQNHAREREDPVHAKIRCNQAAEQRACHRADLLSSEEHAEDAPFVRGRRIAGQDGVDGRMDAAEEEATDELHDGEGHEGIGDALNDHGDAGTRHAETHGLEKTAALPEGAPYRRSHGTSDAAKREDKAGDEDDIRQRSCELGNVCREHWLQDQDDHLDECATEEHIAQQWHPPGRAFIGLDSVLFGCGRFCRCGRFFDDEGKDEEVREECCCSQEEGVAHADRLGEDAAEQGAYDAACSQGALHDAQAEAEPGGRGIECHDGEIHGPESRGKSLEQAHECQLFWGLHDTTEKIADGEEKTSTHGHDALALCIGHFPPYRGHDGRYEERCRKNNARPDIDIRLTDTELHSQIHG